MQPVLWVLFNFPSLFTLFANNFFFLQLYGAFTKNFCYSQSMHVAWCFIFLWCKRKRARRRWLKEMHSATTPRSLARWENERLADLIIDAARKVVHFMATYVSLSIKNDRNIFIRAFLDRSQIAKARERQEEKKKEKETGRVKSNNIATLSQKKSKRCSKQPSEHFGISNFGRGCFSSLRCILWEIGHFN